VKVKAQPARVSFIEMCRDVTLLYFQLLIAHSVERMSEKKRKNTGKTKAEKLEVIREVDKNERSKSEIAQPYGIFLSILSMYLKNRDFIQQKASQGRDVLKRRRVRGQNIEIWKTCCLNGFATLERTVLQWMDKW
jgi:hypothetical protein